MKRLTLIIAALALSACAEPAEQIMGALFDHGSPKQPCGIQYIDSVEREVCVR